MFVALTGDFSIRHISYSILDATRKNRGVTTLLNSPTMCMAAIARLHWLFISSMTAARARDGESERETRFGAVEPLCSFGPREWLTAQVKRQACCL